MGYETDYAPIEYLQRRIKYYKKLRGNARKWPKDELFIKRYGKSKITKLSKRAIGRFEARIKEFENAVDILNNNIDKVSIYNQKTPLRCDG